MTVPEGSIRCSAHTDYGTLTILKSGGPGLQVSKDVESVQWHDVPFVAPRHGVGLGNACEIYMELLPRACLTPVFEGKYMENA